MTLPTLEDALTLGLTREEYELVCDKQGRPPNQLELAMYSLLWSEHCAYKHSRKLLRTLPTEGPHVVMGPGENAGAVDVGGGLACAFKVESHNHPSAVEPFQGAATGVGGILRDIFAIGARPIAVLDSLRFGEPSSARSRYLLDGAVSGIGHYGNSIGVPTVGGEVYFEQPYEHNCLVNAMALGLARSDQLISSAAAGPGNLLVLFGASTGRDGIGGASVLASAELAGADGDGGESADMRPTVQVGDPFAEKKLLECSLELLERGLLVSLQDLGAAGLTSSASEMASKGGVGMDIDVAEVPLREPGMEPFEVMVSESQERMLCVVEPDQLDAVLEVCEKWEVRGARSAGSPTRGGCGCSTAGELVGDMAVSALVDECPLYDLRPAQADRAAVSAPPGHACRWTRRRGRRCWRCCPAPTSPRAGRCSSSTTRSCSRARCAAPSRPTRPCSRSPRRDARLAVSIDGNGRRVAADPYRGTVAAVLECASNLACVGAEPLGTTNNLNFGNPEKAHIAWQLTESVRGLGDACRALGAPIVGGNVSLYNEGATGPIYPTPVIGMVGRLPDARRAGRLGFAHAGDRIALVGPFSPVAGRLRARQAVRTSRCPTGSRSSTSRPSAPPRRPCARPSARARSRAPTTSPRAGLAVALAECCLAGGTVRGLASVGRHRASAPLGTPSRSRRSPRCSARARADSS